MVTVRIVPADLPEVDDLLDRYLDEREATFPSAQGSYSRKRTPSAEFVAPNGVFVVAYDDAGAAVGCGGIRRIQDGPDAEVGPGPDATGPDATGTDATGTDVRAAGPDVRFEVKHVYVAPAGRGQRVASAMMDALESSARDLGATSIVLDTNDSLVAAGAMYVARGYQRTAAYNDNPNATAWFRKPV